MHTDTASRLRDGSLLVLCNLIWASQFVLLGSTLLVTV